jgi:hypothetical protein
MNEKEIRQHIRDTATANRADDDQRNHEYHPPRGAFMPFASDETIHDWNTYDAAYKESRKQSR